VLERQADRCRCARTASASCPSPSTHPRVRFSVSERMNPYGWQAPDGIMRHLAMLAQLLSLLATLRSALRTRAELALENLALCQQLAFLVAREGHARGMGRARTAHGRHRGPARSRWPAPSLRTSSSLTIIRTRRPQGHEGRDLSRAHLRRLLRPDRTFFRSPVGHGGCIRGATQPSSGGRTATWANHRNRRTH
jgi:hypothetical protein